MISSEPIVILSPCYNEELNIVNFLHSLENVCNALDSLFEVVIVNDGSIDKTSELLDGFFFESKNISLTVLELDFNVGHQQAIFQGLIYAKSTNSNQFIVLDSDGQDDVKLIPSMIEQKDCDVVHIVRKKRKESFLFRFSYKIYKMIFKTITGQSIHFGNYCLINRNILNRITMVGFVHFPAFLSKFALRKKYIEADRQKRDNGKSKMGITDLLDHAIKSFVQYAEQLLVVCLWIFISLVIILTIFAGYVLYKKLFTDRAILGWASTIILGLFNGALIALSAFVIGTQLLKNSYSNTIKFTASTVKKNGKSINRRSEEHS
ncbi:MULTISPECIES: glycosyltransferase [Aquimarina]|uniref:Glycosyltransferase n=1 Tax=Aquimarina algiphila TaxID=2047982 RepID=A0A554VEL7_9FLAO|nr:MULTISPECIES: glycosyltransferase [Aquimarina]TSE05536.1 glycosyltransferase [Aquimarina algiphila]